uniref:protein-tyrosine-phosphatase n=1 Tax=Gouania willdenowi TaxID=441366 RepID=A0A8C5EH70_GOUWI
SHRLRSQSIKYRTDKIFTCKTAEKQVNTKKNRYKDIIPFDHSRVKLTLSTSKKDNDYINGSFIQGVSGSRAYIATQGPLPHTVVDFLRMLWEYDIRVVVNACREFEMGKKKCELYWPRNPDTPFVCEPFTVDLDSEEDKGDYITRMLRLTFHNSSRILKQLHYVKWPDHGVPDSIPPILEMLQEMRSYQTHNDIPICIHCSAGCGRTGALCVIDYTWNLLKNQMITSDFNIFDLVQTMRTQRPSVVQTAEQYELVYRTIKYLFEKFLQNIDDQIQENKVRNTLQRSVGVFIHRTLQVSEVTLARISLCRRINEVLGLIPGGPPSPIPPLPEQMPQSFELASDQCNLTSLITTEQLALIVLTLHDVIIVTVFQGEDDQTPPLPERTPESFLLCTENDKPYTSFPQRVGLSSEWGGTCQAKEILNGPMSRSKVRMNQHPTNNSFCCRKTFCVFDSLPFQHRVFAPIQRKEEETRIKVRLRI